MNSRSDAFRPEFLREFSWKYPVRVATTAAGTLASSFENGDTVDGITLATGDRILIKDQATGSENGIYVVAASGAPARAYDMDTGLETLGSLVFVIAGTANGGKLFKNSNTAAVTIGTTALTFAEVTPTASLSGLVDQGVFTYLDATVAAAPGTPASGKLRLYAKTGKHFAQKDDAGVETLLDSTGGGGGGGETLALDVPAASPSSYDDEFTGTSLSGWTVPMSTVSGGGVTTTVKNGLLRFGSSQGGTGSTGLHAVGIRKASPTGSFTVWAKLHQDSIGSEPRNGLWVGVSGGKAHVCGASRQDSGQIIAIGVTTYSETADWSGYDGFLPQFPGSGVPFVYLPHWVRIRWDASASTLYFDFSMDGAIWHNFSSRTGQSQPTAMGIALYSNGTNVAQDAIMGASWFRVIDGSAAFTSGNDT